MSIKRTWKKYRYLVSSNIQGFIKQLKHRTITRISFSTNLDDYQKSISLPYNQLPYPTPWSKIYPYQKLFVEIGFGHGENIIYLSQKYPKNLYVGLEWANRFFKLARDKSQRLKLNNLKLIRTEAYSALQNLFASKSLDGIYLLFPDPWHKTRHHKRRPITAKNLQNMLKKLKTGGFILIVTDWEEYFIFINEQMNELTDEPRQKLTNERINQLTDEETEELTAKQMSIKRGQNFKPEKFGLIKSHYFKKWQRKGRKNWWVRMEKELD